LRFLAVAALLGIAGCSAQVQTTGSYVPTVQYMGHPMPRPREVLVYGFTIDPNSIQLDSGMKARLAAMSGSADPQAERQELAYQITSAISETLVDAINRMGLIAVPAAPGAAARPGDVLIQGQIIRVTAANATRRAIVGFGAGKSEIYANVQVLRAEPGGYAQPLQTYDANANSGRTPGLALGAAGAPPGTLPWRSPAPWRGPWRGSAAGCPRMPRIWRRRSRRMSVTSLPPRAGLHRTEALFGARSPRKPPARVQPSRA